MNTNKSSKHKSSKFIKDLNGKLLPPLEAIIGFSKTMETLLKIDENFSLDNIHKAHKHANSIMKNAKYLNNMIININEIIEVESGNNQAKTHKFCLTEVLQELQSIINPIANNKGLKFNLKYHYPLPKIINSNSEKLQSVLLALCYNAIKFSKHGEIKIDINYKQDSKTLWFAVSDQGIGMDKQTQTKIFTPETNSKKNNDDYGISLYLAKNFAHLLDGDINVRSSLGKGSIFYLHMQLTDCLTTDLAYDFESLATDSNLYGADSNIDHGLGASNHVPILQNYILVVDDWPDNLELMGSLIQRTNATYLFAEDGQKAVELAVQTHPDIILMDIQMPIMNGMQAVQMIRQSGFNKPIIALTNKVTSDDVKTYLQAGFNDYIAKPIAKNKFYEIITRYAQFKPNETMMSNSNSLQIKNNFIRNLPENLKNLQESQSKQDWHTIIELSHYLKKVGNAIGFNDIAHFASNIEKYCLVEKNNSKAIDEINNLHKYASHIFETISKHKGNE